jgi:hypothetical protein
MNAFSFSNEQDGLTESRSGFGVERGSDEAEAGHGTPNRVSQMDLDPESAAQEILSSAVRCPGSIAPPEPFETHASPASGYAIRGFKHPMMDSHTLCLLHSRVRDFFYQYWPSTTGLVRRWRDWWVKESAGRDFDAWEGVVKRRQESTFVMNCENVIQSSLFFGLVLGFTGSHVSHSCIVGLISSCGRAPNRI